MNIIAVDDEQYALSMLEEAIKEVVPNAKLACFLSPDDVLVHAKENKVDVAFLDIDMREMSGLFLAKSLKDIYGLTNIIFVTSYSQYAPHAFDLRASGYVMKPIDPQHVRNELEHLRNPIEASPADHVRFQCFGNFAVFVNGEPLLFTRAKSKELLAYLVHRRGAPASTAEIASILWEDREYTRSIQSQVRNTVFVLMKALKSAGIEDIIQKSWNNIAIRTDKISCDYYEFLEGNASSVNTYMGEYLSEYSWAEFIIGQLNQAKENM